MKYNAMIKRLQRRGLTKEDIAKVVAAREKKAACDFVEIIQC